MTNPSTGEVVGTVPDMAVTDLETATQNAYKAFQTWKKTTAKVDTLSSVNVCYYTIVLIVDHNIHAW